MTSEPQADDQQADDLTGTGAPTFASAHFRTVLGHFATVVTIYRGGFGRFEP